jgi:hypothetical protein
MDEDLIEILIKLTIDSLRNNDNLLDVCTKLLNLIIETFDDNWQCFEYKILLGNFNVGYNGRKLLHMNLTDLNFVIFPA